jgi:hypothetical protein
MFQTKVVEKIKIHILHLLTFFPENITIYGIIWKNIVEPGVSQMAIMAHAHCMLDT